MKKNAAGITTTANKTVKIFLRFKMNLNLYVNRFDCIYIEIQNCSKVVMYFHKNSNSHEYLKT